MSDPSDSKQRLTPNWQQEQASKSSKEVYRESETSQVPQHAEPPPPRAVLLQQASKFLKEDEIKDASTERKVAFLRSKGLEDEEVYRLLELPSDKASAEVKEAGTEQLSINTIRPQPNQQREAALIQSPPQPKENPPIITYPEFLLHSQKPPPLITASRLINSFYLFCGTAAAVYGTSKYLVEPMIQSLTSARRSLASTAQANLDTLNEKLEENVSTISNGVSKHVGGGGGEDDDDSSETTENMAPLFSRTTGTQTSPLDSPSTSTRLSAPSSLPDRNTSQQSSLLSIQSSLSALIPPKDTKSDNDDVKSQINDLYHYLNSLKYPSLHARTIAESKDDVVNKFKAEIRGMKGVLLSARNFPSGATTGRGFGGRVELPVLKETGMTGVGRRRSVESQWAILVARSPTKKAKQRLPASKPPTDLLWRTTLVLICRSEIRVKRRHPPYGWNHTDFGSRNRLMNGFDFFAVSPWLSSMPGLFRLWQKMKTIRVMRWLGPVEAAATHEDER
ncbi:MAG: hypothetical protein Q9166_000209 [cf. Caloplaca sp. 2 TL-2023]